MVSYSLVAKCVLNPLTGILKKQSNTVIGTLAVDGWAVQRRAAAPPSPLLAVPNITADPSTAGVPTSYYSMWHYNYFCIL